MSETTCNGDCDTCESTEECQVYDDMFLMTGEEGEEYEEESIFDFIDDSIFWE